MLDASAAVELLLDTRTADAVVERMVGERVGVPAHFDVEVVGAIRRAVARQLVSDRDGLVAVDDLAGLRIRRWPLAGVIARAYELRDTHSVADGAYVALAEALDCTLVTCDGRLARSHGHDAVIELVD